MEVAIVGVVGSIVGALIGAFCTWLIARRQLAVIERQITNQEEQNSASTQNLQVQLDYQKEQLQLASAGRVDRALELFQRFRYDHMKDARTKAWSARIKWYEDPSYREKLTKRFYHNVYGDLTEEEQEEFSAIHDMLEFYSMLAAHQGNDEEIKAFGFYYTWWRGFLYEIRTAYEMEYSKLGLSDEEKAQFPSVSWIRSFEKLEKRLGLPVYKQEMHPMDREYLPKVNQSALQQTPLPTNST